MGNQGWQLASCNVRPGLAQIFMGALPMVVVSHPELARCGIALCEAVHVLSVIHRRMTMTIACANGAAPLSRTVLLRSPVRSEFVSAAQVRLILDSPRDEEEFTKASVFSTKRYDAGCHLPAGFKLVSLSFDECLACGQPGHASQLESSMASYVYQFQV